MALFAISDLHLSFSSEKPMDIFKGWNDYVNRIESNWRRMISPEDTVVIPGDFSWALKLDDTLADFKFLESLPGKKLLLKGNHDLWWCTVSKMKTFLKENGIESVDFIHNNAVAVGSVAVCGSRGWFDDGEELSAKLILREAGRLETSIKAAKESGLKPVVFLHYPPVYAGKKCDEIFDVLLKHDIETVYHGHIHGSSLLSWSHKGITCKLISCDCIGFEPILISKN